MVAMSLYPKSVSKFIRMKKAEIRRSHPDATKQKTMIAELYKQVEAYKKSAPVDGKTQ